MRVKTSTRMGPQSMQTNPRRQMKTLPGWRVRNGPPPRPLRVHPGAERRDPRQSPPSLEIEVLPGEGGVPKEARGVRQRTTDTMTLDQCKRDDGGSRMCSFTSFAASQKGRRRARSVGEALHATSPP